MINNVSENNIIRNGRISVIVPVLNAEKTLAACLKSLLSQKIDFLELIVVDNASDDKTAEIIKSFAAYDKRIVYIYEATKGRGRARSAALKAVRGDVVAMTDADCLVPDNWLGALTEKIINGEELAVMGFESDAVGNYWTKMRQLEDEINLFKKVKNGFISHLDTKNFACEAKLLKKIGFDENFKSCEDLDLFFNFQKIGIKIKFLPDLRVAHFHDVSAKEVFKTERNRAFSSAAIFKKHKLSEFNKMDFISFPFWAIWQIIKSPYRAPYRILSDFAWKIGLIDYYFYKH